MIKHKSDVEWYGVKPETIQAINLIHSVYLAYDMPEMWVTAVMDGKHSVGSAHYCGYAADIRSKSLDKKTKHQVLASCIEALGPKYFMQLEYEGKDNEHFHVQLRKTALSYVNPHADSLFTATAKNKATV